MPAVDRLDTAIKYLVLAFAAVMGFSRGGIHTVAWLLIVTAVLRFCWRPFPVPLDKELKRALLLFFGALTIASLFSGDIAASVKFLGLSVVKILPFFIVIAVVKEQNVVEQATVLMAGSMLVGAAIATWQGLHGMHRVGGTLGTMDFAGIVGLLVPVLLVKGFEETTGKKVRILYIIAAAVAMTAMMFNGTRAVWVTLAVTCILFVTISLIINWRKNRQAAVMVCALLLIIVLAFINTPSLNHRLHTITDTKFKSNHERILMWRYAIDVFTDHWLLGVGPATLPTLPLSPEEEVRLRQNPTYGHVHNNLLQIAAESGIAGGLAYLFLFYTILKTTVRKMRQAATQSWAMIAFLCTTDYLIHGMFDYTFNIPTIMYSFWLIIGLAYVSMSQEH
ncbi:O-antigen ligase family protein [Anaeroselena agilis]|uniref:O-antigen ligase family protein n=1 Tax=Anaeroselena agilis TaxID=3063788 RepID=A0ABU3P5N2_9FIRM|nr:O-antigen ligase family protein [Selenomonadales bacterium 4137-cl]